MDEKFRESKLYAYAVNLSDFSVKKENIFDNGDDIVAMPRFGYVAAMVFTCLHQSKR